MTYFQGSHKDLATMVKPPPKAQERIIRRCGGMRLGADTVLGRRQDGKTASAELRPWSTRNWLYGVNSAHRRRECWLFLVGRYLDTLRL